MHRIIIYAVIALACAGVGALLWRKLSKTLGDRKFRKRRQRGERGEQKAAAVLAAAGFAILDEQPEQECTLIVDGARLPYTIRADYLVAKQGRRYVAEVKTGKSAPDPRKSATRRQLLEYTASYDVDGTLLVDMEQERIHDIAFERLGVPAPDRRNSARSAWFFLALALALALGTALGYWLGVR